MKNNGLVAILMVIVLALSISAIILPESEYNIANGNVLLKVSYNIDTYYWGISEHSSVSARTIYSRDYSNSTFWWNEKSDNLVDYFLISLGGIAIAIAGSLGAFIASFEKRRKSEIRALSVIAGVGSLLAVIFFIVGNNDLENKLGITTTFYFGFYLTVINIILSFIATAIT
ncbi:hypothetical protein ACNF40_04660 [Cuniculiplasma sp. SKW4]|uniref:hypothetical protein n=1 Tax=Cuniculiplasma sp. SKW4 TaxID=3400171 RepID=UPI003FD0A572